MTTQQQTAWRGLAAALVVVAIALALALLAGCKAMQYGKAGVVPEIIHAQAPGVAEGAGGKITGPANSASPTTQESERWATYFPPFPSPMEGVRPNTSAPSPTPVASKDTAPAVILALPDTRPVVASTYERTKTLMGQHQSATGIVKAAANMEGWSTFRWLALGALVVGVGGMLYSYNNHESGYMMVWMKVAAIGGFCLMASDNPLWLLLLLIPIGFWAIQKWGLFKVL